MRPTGVSTATVDRVINGRGGVHQETVARVVDALRELAGSHPAGPRRSRSEAQVFDIFLPADSGRSTEVLAEALSAVGAAAVCRRLFAAEP